MEFTMNPMGKPRMTQRDKWKKRPVIQRWYAFKDELKLRWGSNRFPSQVYLEFQIPMPESWSKKKKEQMVGFPHMVRPDIDNLIKAVLDSLCIDDNFVCEVHAKKVWSHQGMIKIQPIL